jgi:DtxR family Mn-dependent transcriptional regulator
LHTQSEENYLKAIYELSEFGHRRVNTNDLAEAVKSKPSSATDMIKKLAIKGLIEHQKYRGVKLTESGTNTALKILRKHRLWETFLVHTLNFSWDEVHESAEQLEHVNAPLLINRLDEFLGFPTRDPHGDPIPDQNGILRKNGDILLSDVEAGAVYSIVRVKDSTNSFLKHLDEIEINLQTSLLVIDKYPYDESIKVRINNDKEMVLSGKSCNNLYVNLIKDKS